MIDNLSLIKLLLNFEQPGDFYQLLVLQRKKDQVTNRSNHQSVRTIKSYTIGSIQQLESSWAEIQQLCEVFRARAYIHVQKQNHNDVSLELIQAIVRRLQSGQINQQYTFDSVVGQLKTYEKRWIIDIDNRDEELDREMQLFINQECRPIGMKILANIPTLHGHHLITERFDLAKFRQKYPQIDVHRKNPTLLYCPTSLTETKVTF